MVKIMLLDCQLQTFLNFSALIHYYESELTNTLQKYLLNNRVHDLTLNKPFVAKNLLESVQKLIETK